jgi:predicted alpha/beta-fold hydrolase
VNNNIDVLLTEKGGHVGFLGWGTRYDEVRWADQAISNWIDTHTGT